MAEFERGDIVVYNWERAEWRGSLGVVTQLTRHGVSRTAVHIAWLASTMPEYEQNYPWGWLPEALEKVGHIDLPPEELHGI